MTWDYIIIGAGSAGCALARELGSSRPNATVLLLEAGGPDRSPFIKIPAGQIRAVAKHDWGYESQPDPSRNGATERWSRGQVLGGSSSINGTMFVRGAREDFDRWAQLCGGLGGWSADEVMPIFRELECSDRPGAARGHHGPLHVRTVRHPHPLTEAFVHSAEAVGHAFNEDYNGTSQEGVSYAQLSQRRGLRCSAADAFLTPLRGRDNFTLCLQSLVRRIEFEGRRAVAVSFLHRGVERRECARDIVLCAGAIESPKLLMLSGVGDATQLRCHNIDTAFDLPGLGLNLREHPCIKLVYRTRVPSYNLTQGLAQKIGIAAKFLRHGEGPISNIFEGAAFLRSSADELTPDIQLHFLPIGYLRAPGGALGFTPYPAITVLLNKSNPVSSGRIRLASCDEKIHPLVECRLLDADADVQTLIRGIGTVREIMKGSPMRDLVEEEVAPGIAAGSEATLREYVRNHTEISFHPAGTCRMGTGADAVVGPDLRVRGSENLWIADASIMPDLISGNTNAVCMMIGAKLGRQLAARSSS